MGVRFPSVSGNFEGTTTPGGFPTFSGVFVDTPGAVAAQQYTLTIQQANATVAGTAREVTLIAFAL